MLSKLLRGTAQKNVGPHVWKPSAGSVLSAPEAHERGAHVEPSPPVRLAEERESIMKASRAEIELATENRVREARETAFREGEIKGAHQASAEVRPVIEKLAFSIQHLAGLRTKLREQAEADLVRLALAIAKRVVHRELNTDPDTILGLVKVALSKLRANEVVRVRVHPAHQSLVQELLAHSIASAGHIDVTGDVAAGLGGVIFETSRGEFDFSVDVQLSEIEKGLTDRLAS